MAKSTIRKDRAIRWTTTDNADNTISYVGILKATTPTHYTIDIPGLGELEVDRTDGEFEGVSMVDYRQAVEQDEMDNETENTAPVDEPVNETEMEDQVEPEQTSPASIPEPVNEPIAVTVIESDKPQTSSPKVARRGRSNTDKVFAAAAITLWHGKYKLRFSTDAKRYGLALGKAGHKEIAIIDLPQGNKVQLAGELMTHPMFQYPIAQEVIAEFLAANS